MKEISRSNENKEDLIVTKTREHFLKTIKTGGAKYERLFRHVPSVEKWAMKILKSKPEADRNVVLLGVWLHDIGFIVGDENVDHAVNSEIEARRFLKGINASEQVIENVAHCVRSHRRRDIEPRTLEAKIVTVADSTSRFTEIAYLDMVLVDGLYTAKAKLERDYRDIGLLPELYEEINPLYMAWKQLLEVYPLWAVNSVNYHGN